MNIAHILFSSAFLFPERVLIFFRDRQISYREFLDMVKRAASGLIGLGVRPGDRVTIYAANSIEWLISQYAIWSVGGIMVPINALYKADEAKYIMNHSESSVLIIDTQRADIVKTMMGDLRQVRNFIMLGKAELPGVIRLEEMISRNEPLWAPLYRGEEDGAIIYYTSGTTGRPKGCLLRHNGIYWGSSLLVRAWFKPAEICLIPFPLSFAFGSYVASIPCLQAGGTMVLLEHFSPKLAMEAIQKHGATLMMGVPTMYSMILNSADSDKYDISTLRFVISGGSVRSAELAAAFQSKFGLAMGDAYGLSEATPLASYDMSRNIEIRPGSCGHPLPGIEVKIFDDKGHEVPAGEAGELVTRCPLMMRGYYKDPETTAQAVRGGWLHTGDLAKFDEDGYLYIVGRKKELIIRGGINIFPSEIEDVLYAHPKVAEAVVVGTADEIFGEQVRAVLVLKRGVTATSEEIREYCSKKLAEHKLPQNIEFWSELPKGSTGKILKREIQEVLLKAAKEKGQ